MKFQLRRAWHALKSALVAHFPPFVILGIYLVAYLTLLGDDAEPLTTGPVPIFNTLLTLTYVFAVCVTVLGLVTLAITRNRKKTLSRLFRWVVGRHWTEILLLRIPIAVLLIPTISYFHLSFKINIDYFVPYSWDDYFMRLDQFLFLGRDPWILMHSLMPGILATQILDTIYKFWFLATKLCVYGVAVLPLRDRLRLTFLTAYGLNWLIGGALMAIMFASGGPVYMERLTGDATFAPLMERLHAQGEVVELMALTAQEWLWKGYASPDTPPVGISAFPSLHVTVAVTCAFLGFAVHRLLGYALALYAVGIFVGSVHLGWHYAVDGIAGALLALVCWRVSSRIADWWLAFTERESPERVSGHSVAIDSGCGPAGRAPGSAGCAITGPQPAKSSLRTSEVAE